MSMPETSGSSSTATTQPEGSRSGVAALLRRFALMLGALLVLVLLSAGCSPVGRAAADSGDSESDPYQPPACVNPAPQYYYGGSESN